MGKDYGHKQAVFVGHSYGSAVLTWVVRNERQCVSKAVLIDPICFLLCQPDVVCNFLYSDPNNAVTKAMAHFVRWELFQAHVLFRHFYWYHNNMWADELPDNCTVVLSGNDNIIDPQLVRRYLQDSKEKRDLIELEIAWYPHLGHGAFLVDKQANVDILEMCGIHDAESQSLKRTKNPGTERSTSDESGTEGPGSISSEEDEDSASDADGSGLARSLSGAVGVFRQASKSQTGRVRRFRSRE